MKIIIIGAGKVGRELCKRLDAENHSIVAIDSDEAAISAIIGEADIMGIVGKGELVSLQKEAGVAKADLVIAATQSDETNILSCLVAKSLKAKHTVARVRDPELAEQADFMREHLGIDLMINPEYETAVEISRLLRYPAAAQVDYTDKTRVDIVALEIGLGNTLAGKTLKEAVTGSKLKVLICAVRRGDEVYIPKGDFVIHTGDTIFVTGKYLSIDSFFKRAGVTTNRIRTAMIIGGSKVSRYLAESLHDSGISVKIVEQSKTLCEALSDELDFATIVNGDGTDKALLRQEGAAETDVLISLTESDEKNIMVSLYAKKLGINKIVTKIDNDSFVEIADSLQLGVDVSPKNVVSQQLVRYVRSMTTHDESVLAYYPILGDKAQAIAFKVDNEKLVERTIKSLAFHRDILIACVVKGHTAIIPDGDTVLSMGDVILVVTSLPSIRDVEDILV